MEDYTVEFGNELSGAIIDSFAKKAKTAVCEKKVVIISVENSDKTTESVVTGNAIDILGKIGTLTIDVIKNSKKIWAKLLQIEL